MVVGGSNDGASEDSIKSGVRDFNRYKSSTDVRDFSNENFMSAVGKEGIKRQQESMGEEGQAQELNYEQTKAASRSRASRKDGAGK